MLLPPKVLQARTSSLPPRLFRISERSTRILPSVRESTGRGTEEAVATKPLSSIHMFPCKSLTNVHQPQANILKGTKWCWLGLERQPIENGARQPQPWRKMCCTLLGVCVGPKYSGQRQGFCPMIVNTRKEYGIILCQRSSLFSTDDTISMYGLFRQT